MVERTTTVQMDDRGRLVIPKAVRESLGVEDQSATVEIDVSVVERQ